VLQSGPLSSVLTAAQSALVTERFTARLGVAATREALAGVPMDRLIAAVTALGQEVRAPGAAAEWGDLAQLLPFAPVVDGELLPRPPLEAAADPAGQVPALIGTNRDEGRLFFVPGGVIDAIDDAMLTQFAASNGITDLPAFLPTFRSGSAGETPGEMLVDLYTCIRFVQPAARLAEARGAVPTWMYRFDGLGLGDNDGLGSCHTAEIPFVFATAGRPELRPRIGAHPSAAVTETMHSTWVRFVTSGDPGWAPGTAAYLGGQDAGTTAYLAGQDVHSD